MRRATQFVFSTLVALILLVTPIGYCADSVNIHTAPAHPCCPAKPVPLPDDCARPGCIYMDTSETPAAVADGHDAAPLFVPVPVTSSMNLTPAPIAAVDNALESPPLFQRFVVFHQFRI